MATKAERYRYQQERSSKPPRKPKPRRLKPKAKETKDRNRNNLAGRRGGSVLEDSATGKPSRKSTRKSVNHIKQTTNLQLRAIRKTSSPQGRMLQKR